MNLKRLSPCLLALLPMLPLQSVQAGPDADALGHCLVVNSSEDDKLALVTWMFAAMSMHPAVSELAEVSNADREQSLRAMAELTTVLLTERCREEARTAISSEGAIAMQTSFAILGQVAATELFANPQVALGLAALDTFLDHDALNDALGFEPMQSDSGQ